MTPSDPSVDLVDGVSHGGLNRRQMIKAAGIAGAAAWAAPVIIDSLSSPAAAVSVAPGCYVMYSSAGAGTWGAWSTTQPALTGPACVPTGGCTATTSAAALAAVNLPTPGVAFAGSNTVTVSIAGGYSCRIVSASATVLIGAPDANTCANSAAANGTVNGVAFAGQPSTSVTVKPNGTTSFWDTTAIGPNTSMIGVIIQCP